MWGKMKVTLFQNRRHNLYEMEESQRWWSLLTRERQKMAGKEKARKNTGKNKAKIR